MVGKNVKVTAKQLPPQPVSLHRPTLGFPCCICTYLLYHIVGRHQHPFQHNFQALYMEETQGYRMQTAEAYRWGLHYSCNDGCNHTGCSQCFKFRIGNNHWQAAVTVDYLGDNLSCYHSRFLDHLNISSLMCYAIFKPPNCNLCSRS